MNSKLWKFIFLMLFVLKGKVLAQTDHSPSLGIGVGGHGTITGHDTMSSGVVGYTFFNFPFDQAQRWNWESSFHLLQFNNSEGQKKIAFSIMYIGLKFYVFQRNTKFRPYLSAGISGVEKFYIPIPHFNGNAGIEYTFSPTYSIHLQVSSLSTGLDVEDGNLLEKDSKHRTTAVLFGLRYQL